MPEPIDGIQVTVLLKAMAAGDENAAAQLLPIVYTELHGLARHYMRGERAGHTLQPTALINEAYMRLANQQVDWNSREHFIALAANTMRRVLVDYARAHRAERRGGSQMQQVELSDDLAISPQRLDEIVWLDDALKQLEQQHPRQAKVVELRHFAGLSVEEAAVVMGVAPRSVKRDWMLARMWLYQYLHPQGSEPPPK